MEGVQKIIVAHSNPDFCTKFADSLEGCGFDVSIVKSLKDIIKKVEASGADFGLMGIPLDEAGIQDVSLLEKYIEDNDLSSTKLFAIISPKTKFSQVILEKIKSLKPRDFIMDSCCKDEILFRLSNILYEDNGLRKNFRALMNIPVHCDHMQDFFDTESFTISRDGIYLKTDREFNRDTKLFLTFKIPSSKRGFATVGSVLYTISENSPKPRISPPGSGLYFVDLSSDERDTIDRYIRGSA